MADGNTPTQSKIRRDAAELSPGERKEILTKALAAAAPHISEFRGLCNELANCARMRKDYPKLKDPRFDDAHYEDIGRRFDSAKQLIVNDVRNVLRDHGLDIDTDEAGKLKSWEDSERICRNVAFKFEIIEQIRNPPNPQQPNLEIRPLGTPGGAMPQRQPKAPSP